MFNDFWNAYPRKVGKPKCLAWFKSKKVDEELLAKILSGLKKWKCSKQWQDIKYVPHPLTWLNRDGWCDEVLEDKKTPELSNWFTDIISDLKKEGR